MKERKRCLGLLSFYDHTGMEHHFAAMARKGWLIERMSNWFWTYRRIEPQQLHFTVCYFAKASAFDPAACAAQQTLIDYCVASGWQLACTWFQLQVFYHTGENPTPIHTEPALEVAALHAACKVKYLRNCKLLLLFSLCFTLLFLSSLVGDTLRTLASPGDLMCGVLFLLLFLWCLTELVVYYSWHRKAKQAAEQGMFLDSPPTATRQKGILLVLGLCVVGWLFQLYVGSSSPIPQIFLALFLLLAATVVLAGVIMRWLNKRNISSRRGRRLMAIASFLTTFILICIAAVPGTQLLSALQREAQATFVEAPLQISDLLETEDQDYLLTTSREESPLLARLEVEQRQRFGDAVPPDSPELRYVCYLVKAPVVYDFCQEQLRRLMALSVFQAGAMVEQDAAPWDLERVYQLLMDDGTAANVYLLCDGDLLVWVEFGWQLDAEQMGIAGRKLAGECMRLDLQLDPAAAGSM